MSSLTLSGINKDFGNHKGVNNITFTVESGEFFVILGPSGCGKTTTLRIIAGLEQPDSGKIFIDDQEITNYPPKYRDMSMVFQNYALYPFLTVKANIEFPLKKRKVPRNEIEEKMENIAKILSISDILDRKPGEISGGQRQRVALGRALIREPSVFLMDEPLSNLDAKLRTSMRGELKRIQREFGITTVYVTHDQIEAMTLADRTAVMSDGHVIQIDNPMYVYTRPVNVFVATFVGDPSINIIPGELIEQNNEIVLKIDSYIIPVPNIEMPDNSKSLDVKVGIRPEDLEISDNGIAAKLTIIQPLGSRRYEHYTLDFNNEQLIRATSSLENIELNTSVKLAPRDNKFILFNATNDELIYSMLQPLKHNVTS